MHLYIFFSIGLGRPSPALVITQKVWSFEGVGTKGPKAYIEQTHQGIHKGLEINTFKQADP